MLRRKNGSPTDINEPDILPHNPNPQRSTKVQSAKSKTKGKAKISNVEKRGTSGEGNKWVMFLDVALTCPSDESDDELAFCKPAARSNLLKR